MKTILSIVWALLVLAALVGGMSAFTCLMFALAQSSGIPELLQFFGLSPWLIIIGAIALNAANAKH